MSDFKVGDYIYGELPWGSRSCGINQDGTVKFEPAYKQVRGVLEMVFEELKVNQKNGYWVKLSELKNLRLAQKRNFTNRYGREDKIEASFNLTENMPFNLTTAKRFNTKFCKDFGIIKSRIKIVDVIGNGRIGQHSYWQKIILIKASLNDKQRWQTLFHEVAHYREHSHSKSFHDEMAMVYRRFVMWAVEKNFDVAAEVKS